MQPAKPVSLEAEQQQTLHRDIWNPQPDASIATADANDSKQMQDQKHMIGSTEDRPRCD